MFWARERRLEQGKQLFIVYLKKSKLEGLTIKEYKLNRLHSFLFLDIVCHLGVSANVSIKLAH